jgi:predicted permease
VPPDRLAAILGDLATDYARVLSRRGRLLAAVWILSEGASLVGAYRRGVGRGFVDKVRVDVVHGWRAIRARPAAALGTVGVVSVGIGLVSAMFALADPYVTRPLPFDRADRLVTLSIQMPSTRDFPTLDTWRARRDLFVELAVQGDTENVVVAGAGGDGAVPLRLLPVSANFLQVLGAAALPLRDWHARAGANEKPAVLTAAASRRLRELGESGARLEVLEETGARSGQGYRVHGALPTSFLFPSGTQFWDGLVPLHDQAELVTVGRTRSGLPVVGSTLTGLARMQSRVTAEQVAAALSKGSIDGHWFLGGSYVVRATSVRDMVTGGLRPLATGALYAGLLVLLISAANVANLLIVRGLFRRREFAAREAFGASRVDLGRLVLVEIGLLTICGIGGGLIVASAVLSAAATVIPAQFVLLGLPQMSFRVVVFATAAGGVVMAAGLVPALAARRLGPQALFHEASPGEPRRIRAARFAMTAAQTSVAVVLLVGAVLMARSYLNLLTRDPGYARDVYAVGVRYDFPGSGRPLRADIDASVDGLRRIESVTAAAATIGPLVEAMGGGGSAPALFVDGQRAAGRVTFTGPGFFQAVGGRLLEGRLLVDGDEGRAALVSESFARACCADRPALGRHLEWKGFNSVSYSMHVVGVVKDVLAGALDQAPVASVFTQFDDRTAPQGGWVTYVVRADRPTAALANAVEREIQAIAPHARVSTGGVLRERLLRSIQDRTFATLIVGLFTLAGVGVSAAGLVGVVGFVVGRRTREIAIRTAIGARRSDVMTLVTREAALASATGGLAGLVAGAWLSKSLASLLFGVEPADPASIAFAAVLLVLIVVGAAWVPTRRALRLSPAEALRVE